jgi:hypothetical protein
MQGFGNRRFGPVLGMTPSSVMGRCANSANSAKTPHIPELLALLALLAHARQRFSTAEYVGKSFAHRPLSSTAGLTS